MVFSDINRVGMSPEPKRQAKAYSVLGGAFRHESGPRGVNPENSDSEMQQDDEEKLELCTENNYGTEMMLQDEQGEEEEYDEEDAQTIREVVDGELANLTQGVVSSSEDPKTNQASEMMLAMSGEFEENQVSNSQTVDMKFRSKKDSNEQGQGQSEDVEMNESKLETSPVQEAVEVASRVTKVITVLKIEPKQKQRAPSNKAKTVESNQVQD